MLNGIKVLDFSRVLAGPIATMILGDLGAEIIKVEPPRGDETRSWAPIVDGESVYYLSINRNKKSVVIDLKKSESKDIVRRLIKRSDVIIENFRPGVAESLGIDYKTAKKLRPDIIYCSIKGFGRKSPYKGKPAYDLLLQAMSGLMSTTGEEGRPPVRVAFALFDIISGLIAASSILAALINRIRSGEGRHIEVSLYDASIFSMSYVAMIYLMTGKPPKRMGSAHPSIVPYQAFRCKDGYITVAAANDKFWARLCKALGLEQFIGDPRFKTNVKRVANREQLIPILEKIFIEKDRDEWWRTLSSNGVPCSPVYSLEEVFRDPHVKKSGIVAQVVHRKLGYIPQLLFPVLIDSERLQAKLPPPTIGENTKEILVNLGYKEEEIAELFEKGVVCCRKQ